MDVLVAYDIDTTTRTGERRLGKVPQVCEGYGSMVQYSVFECRLSAAGLQRLIADLREVIELDGFLLCRYGTQEVGVGRRHRPLAYAPLMDRTQMQR
ncbi:MAG: CRISPR-associated endonuclease Cas2 [Candidatus Dormibacteria bacterium]